ncbi:MAG TPA: HDIG domain-containing protein [Thermoguttaceae bacterium]|nr:HDIG domain-containing protein [Thermoguttaceae bacterium]
MAASGSRKTRSERVAALEMPPSKFERALASLGRRDVLARLAIGVAAAVALAVVMHASSPPFAFREGYVPPRDVVSRAAFRQFDQRATEEEREDAKDQARAVYVQNPAKLIQLQAELRNTIRELAAAKRLDGSALETWSSFEPPRPADAAPRDDKRREERFRRFQEAIAGEEKQAQIDETVASALKPYETYGLLEKPGPGNEDEILVYREGEPDTKEPVRVSDVMLGDGIGIKNELAKNLGSLDLADHLFTWLYPKLAQTRTLTLDQPRTAQSQEEAVREVEDVYIHYEAGQTLVKQGKTLDEKDLALLRLEYQAFEAQRNWGNKVFRAAAVLSVIAILFSLTGIYLFRRQRKLLVDWRRLGALLLLVVFTLVVARWAARDSWCAEIVPLLLFAQIVAIVYDRELAMLLAGAVALCMVISLGLGLGEMMILFGTTATVVFQLSHIRSRGKLTMVGFVGGLIAGLLTIVAAVLDDQPARWELLFNAAQNAGLTLFAGLLMSALLPVIERLFGVLTDISLLELGDVAHPLLQELIRRAPSTYNHSITVGSIAEAAAEAIGGRGLLVRVGAYFHDIGKMLKPGYFIENQGDEANRHETLVPAMSTLVIIAHIKDGANLARQHHLPEPIIDFILQHHGTTLVGYFFERANQQSRENPDGGTVEESSFRYPGPKPQTKEAAVLMLADAVESASRTLVGPTPARIDSLVREIAERRLEDGQFDESGLTLRELRTIEDSMIKTVTAIYHGRVKYPDQRTA